VRPRRVMAIVPRWADGDGVRVTSASPRGPTSDDEPRERHRRSLPPRVWGVKSCRVMPEVEQSRPRVGSLWVEGITPSLSRPWVGGVGIFF
jgi:hypothetical protein